MRSGRFMTLCLTVIDAEAGMVRWASAGHDPALVYDPAADSFQELDAGGIPLGVDDFVQYQEHTYGGLREGCIITLGTDGIWETNNGRGSWFGKERLKDVIRRSAGGSAQDISEAIQQELETFRGSARQRDDVTFVVVKLVPVLVDREEKIEAEFISAVV
jgi:sigma-B regulation protein RsbU (phosphoserine phosphatase)